MHTLLKWIQASWNPPASAGPELAQQRRLQLALAVLVIALLVVIVRDIHELQPPSSAGPEPATVAESNPAPAVTAAPPAVQAPSLAEPKPPASSRKARHSRVKRPVVKASQSSAGEQLSPGPTIVATERAVLPPLQVQVVGGQHRPAAPGNNSVSVDMQSGVPATAGQTGNEESKTGNAAPPTPATHVTVSPDVAQHVVHTVAPSYPLLAKQMKVQGAVVLQALIDKGGKIQSLRVLSGPAILAAAAEEAVKQWRFKPYYQGGQPVETEARVSVNFTISTF